MFAPGFIEATNGNCNPDKNKTVPAMIRACENDFSLLESDLKLVGEKIDEMDEWDTELNTTMPS